MKKFIILFFCIPVFFSCTNDVSVDDDTEVLDTTTNSEQKEIPDTVKAFGKAYGKYMYYKQINDPNYTDYVIEEATNLLEEFGEPTMEHQYEFTDSKEQTVEKAYYKFIELTKQKNK